MKKLLALAMIVVMPNAASGQSYPLPADVASPRAIVAATYESINRAPGEQFNWDRFRSLWIDDAYLVPNTEQTGGEFRVMTVDGFIEWVDAWYAENAPIDAPGDKGFVEAEIHSVVQEYGDVAQVMSTYDKHFHGETESLGRGINSMQLVFDGKRWWIVSNVWDEENGGGPIPKRYLPE